MFQLCSKRRASKMGLVWPWEVGIVVLGLVVLASCKDKQDAAARPADARAETSVDKGPPVALPADAPAVLVRQFMGMEARYEHAPQTGLRLAVWEDGLVLYGIKDPQGKEIVRVGRVDAAVVTRTLDRIGQLGFFDSPSQRIQTPDASWVVICAVHNGNRNAMGWDGVSRAGEYDAFEKRWKAVRGALDQCIPEELQAFESVKGADGCIRGFRLEAPMGAKWFDYGLWWTAEVKSVKQGGG